MSLQRHTLDTALGNPSEIRKRYQMEAFADRTVRMETWESELPRNDEGTNQGQKLFFFGAHTELREGRQSEKTPKTRMRG